MNTADSEEMGRTLVGRGFGFTQTPQDADAILINTCTVRQHAEDKAFSFVGTLREWKEANPNRLLIVAGCAAERTKDVLQKRFPYVDLVVGAKSIEQFPEIVEEALKEKFSWEKDNVGVWPDEGNGKEARAHCAYVTIMRGCNYTCTYCIVPFVRGREIYRPAAAILKEVETRVREGAKEIMLLGQTVNSYRGEGEIVDFSDLLKTVAQIQGVERIRFMSPHPYYFNDKLIETLAATPQVCNHIHLPVQSGSNRILKLMRRNYTRERYLEIVQKLRAAIPNIAITTDIIAGFPTETEQDFDETMDLIWEGGFNGAYCFKFSPRDGTDAANLEGQIDQETKECRLARALELTEDMGRKKAQAQIGQVKEVLWHTDQEGFSRDSYKVELLNGQKTQAGSAQPVNIEGVKSRKLLGRLVS
ncbi:MAG: tRNA (N6-isopentenyl adenosine(37)-C2)-methylthiotransferase MiaB [Elusimicrobia bacterium]|nr:tRNA (N6-isopentenyl adenosine(37)-C2)-methylthiotransferase MiaB [Elusimicrobiota bacterium]